MKFIEVTTLQGEKFLLNFDHVLKVQKSRNAHNKHGSFIIIDSLGGVELENSYEGINALLKNEA